MYVHEYDCKDEFSSNTKEEQTKRVYIAYLDSVEYFRPRQCRSRVFHEMIVSCIATARARGTKPTTDPTSLGEMVPRREGVLDGRLVCPPLMDGDYWVEEAVRCELFAMLATWAFILL